MLGSVRAAGLPDWAEEWVDRAPPITDGVPKHRERILFRERTITVEPRGSVTVRLRTVRQFLSSRDEIAIAGAPYSSHSKIELARLWHLPPRGRAKRSGRDDYHEVMIDDSFVGDLMARFVHIDGVVRGSLVFAELRSSETPYGLSFAESFVTPVLTDRADLVVRVPPGWSLRHEWLRREGVPPVVEGDSYRFTLGRLEPAGEEILAPSALELAPLLVVSVTPPDGLRSVASAFEDWAAVGRWYDGIAEGRDAPGNGVAAVAAQLGNGRAFDRVVPALAAVVRDQVRYVAREIGIDGYRPRAAEETLANRYGDCKDKAILLRALLARVGVESYPLLVSAGQADRVPRTLPDLGAFDHMIVAARADEVVAASYPAAAVRTREFGPLVLIDPTAENVAFGSIPSVLEGRRGLLLAGPDTAIIDLPVVAPEGHAMRAAVDLTITPDGGVRVDMRAIYRGQPAADRRDQYRSSSAAYRDAWVERLHETWIDATILAFDVEAETDDGAFVERASFRAPRPLGDVARGRVPLFAGLGPFLPDPPLRRRETPVRFPYRTRIDLIGTLSGAPPEAAVPSPSDETGKGFAVTARAERVEGRIVTTGAVVLDRTDFAVAELPELTRLLRAIDRVTETAIALAP